MIERIPLEAFTQRNFGVNQIWLLRQSSKNIEQNLSTLYKATSYRKKSIYGVNFFQGDQNQSPNLTRAQLSLKAKSYIIGCYWMLNWQPITIKDVSQIVENLPTSENELEQIKLEDNCLKFIKGNLALYYCLANGELQIKQNKQFFNSSDKSGKHQLLQYEKSIKKLTINSIPYFYSEKICEIESCQSLAAVTTNSSLYVFSLKINPGQQSKFLIQNCIDVKWSEKGLYYLQKNGTVGLIERQRNFIDKYRGIGFSHSGVLEQIQIEQQYACQRLVVVKQMLLGLFFHVTHPNKIIFRILNHRYAGRIENKQFRFTLSNVRGEIMYQNIVAYQGYIILILCTGQNGLIKCINEYTFGC